MTQIQYSRRQDYTDGKPNEVVSLTDVEVIAGKFTDGQGRENVLIGLVFGVNPQTGEPNIVVMNPEVIQANFVMPSPPILTGLLRLYKQRKSSATPVLPDGAPEAFPMDGQQEVA